ncbi:MAG: GNAT family N-acetyltransferase [Verrucomicrobia bacterium]|nr:GNAT family N-acetyltransferase [Verrucomicrobiota bacterium]
MSSSSPNHAEAKITSVGSHETNRLIGLVRAFHGESGRTIDPEQAEAIRQLSANSTLGQAWMLTIDDRDIGYGLVYFRHSIDHGGRIAVLDDLWITADHRGQGRGALLLRAICEDLKAMGVRAVQLEVDPENEVALALYSRFGFSETGTALRDMGLM